MSSFTRPVKIVPVPEKPTGWRKLLPPGWHKPTWEVAERFEYAVGSLNRPAGVITVLEGGLERVVPHLHSAGTGTAGADADASAGANAVGVAPMVEDNETKGADGPGTPASTAKVAPAVGQHADATVSHMTQPWTPFESAPVKLLKDWYGMRWRIMMTWILQVRAECACGVGGFVAESLPCDLVDVVCRPWQSRLLPSYHFTIGEAIIAFLCLVGTVVVCVASGVDDTEGAAGFAVIPLLATFATVNHNSVWTYLLGIPFERALAWHKFFAWLAIFAGGWHGFAAINVEVRLKHLPSACLV